MSALVTQAEAFKNFVRLLQAVDGNGTPISLARHSIGGDVLFEPQALRTCE